MIHPTWIIILVDQSMKYIKRLPTIDSMSTFETAARHLSFTRAAIELNLSQSAVSRQVQQLEERLGVQLFIRRHKDLELTQAGQILMRGVGQAVDIIHHAISQIQSNEGPVVKIHCSLAIASYWLLPGLNQFRSRHPEINIRLISSDANIDLRQEKIDFMIRYGNITGYGKDFGWVKLFEEQIFPVASAQYMQGRQIEDLNLLVKEKLIGMNLQNDNVADWSRWLKLVGCHEDYNAASLIVSNFDLALRAALSGQGVALMWACLANQDLFANQQLLRVTDQVLSTGIYEHLIFHQDTLQSDAHRVFYQWLVDYAAETRHWIQRLLVST